ncbi:MAG: hypothetical protein ACR2JF_07645 [Iamia sp.]
MVDVGGIGGEGLDRRTLLRGAGGVLGAAAAGSLLSGCEPPPPRSAWRQSFTTPRGGDVTLVGVGGWCWFTEARTLLTPAGRLYLGTVANGTGTARDGTVEVHSVDVSGGLTAGRPVTRSALARHNPDDHNNPGLELTSTGGVLTTWSAHVEDLFLRRAHDPGGTGAFTVLDPIERPDVATPPGRAVAYGSLHRLDDVGVTLVAYRGEQYSWNLMRSFDDGLTWEPLGLLLVPPEVGERPYPKFASDGRRLWFATTEGHPRTYQPTSVRVGAVDADGVITDDSGAVRGGTGAGVSVTSLPYAYQCPANADSWVSEVRVVGGRLTISASLRGPRVDSAAGAWAHDHLRIRSDGEGRWSRELVARGGGELGGNVIEPDYTGLAALDPSTHNRMVVATNVHPTDGVALRSRADGRVHFELWQMDRSTDGTGRWHATALTRDSTEDNIRPHVARRGDQKILSWVRGWYHDPNRYATSIVSRQAA